MNKEHTTQGSRHVLAGLHAELLTLEEGIATQLLNQAVPATTGKQQFFGPLIVAKEAVTIEHPEHAHVTLPAGVYLTTYQRTWAKEIRRTQD